MKAKYQDFKLIDKSKMIEFLGGDFPIDEFHGFGENDEQSKYVTEGIKIMKDLQIRLGKLNWQQLVDDA